MSRSTAWRWASLAGLCALAACSSIFSRQSPQEGGDQSKVSHKTHVEAGVDCATCHEQVFEAKSLEGNFLPPEQKCMECHEDEKKSGNCAKCHSDVSHAGPYIKRDKHLNLSHKNHIPRVKGECTVCHVALPEPVREGSLTPPMSACLSCHQKDYDQGRCEKCHTDLVKYPLKPVSGFSHQGNWVKDHPGAARASAASCASCHEQSFCADCHASTTGTRIELKMPERVESDFIHRSDWLSRHNLEARADPAMCARCHGKSFCESCHRAQNLAPTGSDPRNPHPPGWSFPGPNSHGSAARRDIGSCAACHDQGRSSVCVDCHRVGGMGGDPHPPGWSSRHGRPEIQSNSMCLYCHL